MTGQVTFLQAVLLLLAMVTPVALIGWVADRWDKRTNEACWNLEHPYDRERDR